MVTLEIRFPGRRYHATPWGHHVNEGLVEWPPSPWRLLRALLATGYTKLGWREGALSPTAVALLEKLGSVLPDFGMPSGVAVAHSRHYMPAPVKTTLVFDTWAQVDAAAFFVRWSVDLTSEERELLASLAERLSYLGRAESWTAARLLTDDEAPGAFETAPCSGAGGGPGLEQVSVLAALPPAVFGPWRSEQVERALAAVPPASTGARKPTAKQLAKHEEQRRRAAEPFPADLVSCLGVDTAWLQGHGWSQPPGSRRVLYWRRRDALEVGPPRSPHPPEASPIEAVLFALATETRGRGGLPEQTRAFPQALRLHRALAGIAKGLVSEETRRCLLGKDGDRGAETGHRHAHVLPLHLDPASDGKLDHVLVWAPGGLDSGAQRVLRRLRRLERTATDSTGELDRYLVTIAGEGSLDVLAGIGEPLRRLMRSAIGRSSTSDGRRWKSVTPFFAPRFLKPRGKNTLEGQLRAELEARGLPTLESATLFRREELVEARFLHYLRRANRKAPKVDTPLGLRLVLAEPVPADQVGPLCLGFGSHFGLGRFEPE